MSGCAVSHLRKLPLALSCSEMYWDLAACTLVIICETNGTMWLVGGGGPVASTGILSRCSLRTIRLSPRSRVTTMPIPYGAAVEWPRDQTETLGRHHIALIGGRRAKTMYLVVSKLGGTQDRRGPARPRGCALSVCLWRIEVFLDISWHRQ